MCLRCLCCCCCIIFDVIFIIGLWFLINWLVIYNEVPVYHVKSFTVSDFGTKPPFTATWSTKFNVENKKYNVRMHHINTVVFAEHWLVASSKDTPDIELDKESKKEIEIVTKTNSSSDLKVNDETAQDIGKIRDEEGKLKFEVVLTFLADFKSTWEKRSLMTLKCKGLDVKIDKGSSKGELANGAVITCSHTVFVYY